MHSLIYHVLTPLNWLSVSHPSDIRFRCGLCLTVNVHSFSEDHWLIVEIDDMRRRFWKKSIMCLFSYPLCCIYCKTAKCHKNRTSCFQHCSRGVITTQRHNIAWIFSFFPLCDFWNRPYGRVCSTKKFHVQSSINGNRVMGISLRKCICICTYA